MKTDVSKENKDYGVKEMHLTGLGNIKLYKDGGDAFHLFKML